MDGNGNFYQSYQSTTGKTWLFNHQRYGFSIRSWPMVRHTVSKGIRRLTRLTFHSLGWISGRQESGRYRDRVGFWHVMWTLVYVHPIIVTDSHLEYQTFSKWKNTLRILEGNWKYSGGGHEFSASLYFHVNLRQKIRVWQVEVIWPSNVYKIPVV